jgi:deoxyribonuclease IV
LTRHTPNIRQSPPACVKDLRARTRKAGANLAHRLGAHLSIAGGMHHALEAALRLRCDTVQVFVKNQRQWRAAPLDPDDVAIWHRLRATVGFGPVVAHATYLVNLASADRRLFVQSRDAFAEELQRCQALGIRYLVVHPGSAVGSSAARGIARVADALNTIFDRSPDLETMPLLETTAGQGAVLGRSFDELAEIIRRVEQPARVGVCVDSCHVFAAGYDIRVPVQYDAMIAEAARTVGLERIRCWHVNDSQGDCGSHLDRHAHIGQGRLGNAAFRNLLGDARFFDVPMILETPKGTDAAGRDFDRLNLRRLRSIARRAAANVG